MTRYLILALALSVGILPSHAALLSTPLLGKSASADLGPNAVVFAKEKLKRGKCASADSDGMFAAEIDSIWNQRNVNSQENIFRNC